jgi:hypothetical protein
LTRSVWNYFCFDRFQALHAMMNIPSQHEVERNPQIHTPPHGYLAALLGSMLEAALLGWLGGLLAVAMYGSGPAPGGFGPIIAIVFGMFGLGWLSTRIGCTLALCIQRATAISVTTALVVLLAPAAAVLHFNVLSPILENMGWTHSWRARSGRWSRR